MKNFRTYVIAMELFKECQQVKCGPGALKNQFERASLSIVLNLAEGVGRRLHQILNSCMANSLLPDSLKASIAVPRSK